MPVLTMVKKKYQAFRYVYWHCAAAQHNVFRVIQEIHVRNARG